MLLSGTDTIFEGDFDMQIQMLEAAKISIQNYGQFPLWNPWVSGGVPLFADPQFGLFTPQMLLSFFTTSAFAWKLTILIYMLVGFFSMKKLLFHINSGHLPAIALLALSYLWIMNGFFALRSSGHFTFFVLTLLPLALYLLLTLNQSRKSILLLTALLTYCMYAALHYSTVLILMILFVVSALLVAVEVTQHIARNGFRQTIRMTAYLQIKSVKSLALLTVAVVGSLLLAFPRLYLSLAYLHDNSVDRSGLYENYIGIGAGLKALFLPYGSYTIDSALFGEFEASSYIGEITALLILVAASTVTLGLVMKRAKNVSIPTPMTKRLIVAFSIIAIASFLIGLGGDLFALIRQLPVLSSMRVSTRYFFVTAFFLITLLSMLLTIYFAYTKKALYRYPLYGMVIIATLQVAIINYRELYNTWYHSTQLEKVDYARHQAGSAPRSERLWNLPRPKEGQITFRHKLTEATVNNRAQFIADNALVDTRVLPTQRCDEDEPGCRFVLSKNAQIAWWTPNTFKLIRTGPGEVRLNMNQGSYWRVNGNYLFEHQKTVNSNSTLTIPDDKQRIYVVDYRPTL